MSADDASRSLQLEELSSLRLELNATIDRMNSNENFVAGATSALLAFLFSLDSSATVAIASVVPIGFVLFGYVRNLELQEHMSDIDRYLIRIEGKLCDGGGWSTHFAESVLPRRRLRFALTRRLFWGGLLFVSSAGAIAIVVRAV